MDNETFEITKEILDVEEYEELKEALKKRRIQQMLFPEPIKRNETQTEFVKLTTTLDKNLKLFKKIINEENKVVYILSK